jgi:tetratricopeptide (TPR) repeat protein
MGRMKFSKFGLARFQKLLQKLENFRPQYAPFTPLILNGFLFLFLSVLVLNFLYSRSLILQKQKNDLVKIQIDKISHQISSWENIVKEFPGFRDAHLKLAILNLKLSRVAEAKKYLEEVLKIDPNNMEAKTILSSLPL